MEERGFEVVHEALRREEPRDHRDLPTPGIPSVASTGVPHCKKMPLDPTLRPRTLPYVLGPCLLGNVVEERGFEVVHEALRKEKHREHCHLPTPGIPSVASTGMLHLEENAPGPCLTP